MKRSLEISGLISDVVNIVAAYVGLSYLERTIKLEYPGDGLFLYKSELGVVHPHGFLIDKIDTPFPGTANLGSGEHSGWQFFPRDAFGPVFLREKNFCPFLENSYELGRGGVIINHTVFAPLPLIKQVLVTEKQMIFQSLRGYLSVHHKKNEKNKKDRLTVIGFPVQWKNWWIWKENIIYLDVSESSLNLLEISESENPTIQTTVLCYLDLEKDFD
jgi:hypothetical protein